MERNYEREKNVKEMRKTDEPTIPRIPSVRFSVRRLCFFSPLTLCAVCSLAWQQSSKKKFHVSCAAYLHQKRNRTNCINHMHAHTHSLTHKLVQSAIYTRIQCTPILEQQQNYEIDEQSERGKNPNKSKIVSTNQMIMNLHLHFLLP